MCNRCHRATARKGGSGPFPVISYLTGALACKHSPDCSCDSCSNHRDDYTYSDFGLLLGERPVKE